MPTYEVDVQGKTYEVDAPDANTAWQWANYTHTQAPAPTKSAGFSLGNTALGLGQGVIGAGKSLTDVFGADNAVSAALGRGQSALGEMKTPERQAEQAARQAKIKAAEGTGFLNEVGAELGAVVEAPIESTAQAVGSVVPYLVTGLVGGAAKLLPATVRVINTIVGAAQGAGSIKGSIYDAVYDRLKGTMSDAKAKEQAAIAQEYNKENALDIAGGTLLGAAGARFGVEEQLVKGGTKKAIGKAVLEEAPMEGLQGGQEKTAQNRALQRAGFDVDTFQGVAGRAAGDAALGALAAGSVSAVQGSGAQPKSVSDVRTTVDTQPTTEPVTPVSEAPATYGTMWQAREQLKQEPQTPEVKAAIAELSAKMDAINIADVEAQTKRPFPTAGDEAKAKQSAFNLPPEGAQMEMAGVGTTDRLPPEVDANGNPLRPFVGPDRDVGLGDVIAADLPPTTEVLNDAGIAPTQAELEAAGQQRLDMATPNPISEAEVTAFGASMSKPNRQWLVDNILGKTPDQVQMEIAYNRLVVPNNKGLQKVIKEIVANVTPKEPQNAPSTQPAIQPTPRARGRKPSVDVSVPPTDANEAAPAAGVTTGQPEGLEGQRLVPPEQPTTTGTQQQGIKPPTLKRRVKVDTAEIARQQEAADIATRLAEQAQASAMGKPAPEQRTVVEDQSKANRAEALRRAEEAAQKLEAATDEEEKAAVQQKAPKASTISTAQIVGALKELIRSPQVSAKDKQDAKRHLEAVQEKKGKDVSAGKEDDLSEEMAFNFLVEQANKPRFQRTETPATPMPHEKVKAIVARIMANWKNAPEVIVVRDMNDAAVPQAVRDHNNEQLAGGAKGSPAGFYHDGKVFIVSGQVNSAADVMTTLAHEALGHFGLRGVFGTALDTELKAVETTYKAEMEAVAAKYGLDLSDPQQASEAAEEVLANLAQTKPTLGIVQRAVAAIRAFIRKIMPSLQMTNNDIIAKFILPARAFVESGGSAVAADGGTRFNLRGKITAPTTEAFKRWFGDSKIVGKDGKALVVYHGTNKNFNTFDISRSGSSSGEYLGKGFYFAQSADTAGAFAGEKNAFVMPVYLAISNPFNTTSTDLTEAQKQLIRNDPKLGKHFKAAEGEAGNSTFSSWYLVQRAAVLSNDRSNYIKNALELAGFDGVITGDLDKQPGAMSEVEIVTFRPEQIKSATGNRGTYDPTNPDIRFSRGDDAKDILQRMGRTTPVEDTRPILQRITDTVMGSVKANTPKEGAITRVLNMAEDALDVSAPLQRAIRDEVRASMPDSDANRLLAALSTSQAFHDSGLATAALLDGGIKYDSNSSKFKTSESKDNLKSLGTEYRSMMDTHGLTLAEARYLTSTALESKRMLALYAMRDSMMAEADAKELEGKKKIAASLRDKAESYVFHMSPEQVKEGMKLFNTLPEIKKIEDIKQGMRKWLRTFLQETGIWSEETGQWMLDNAEWVPFQRDSADEDTDKEGFNAYIRGLQAKAKEHQFKGSMLAVHDVMDNFESWAAYSVARGIKNQKATELAQAAVKYIPGQAKAVVTPDPRAADRTVSYLEKGSPKYVEFDSAAKAQVFKGAPVMAKSALPFIGGLVDNLNSIFRGAIVNFPLFPVYQLAMDSMAATYLSGLKPRYAFQIPLTAVSEAIKNIRGMSAAHKELRTFGVVGVHDYDASLSKSNADVKAGLRKLGALDKYPAIMQHLNLTADNAVRQAVYLAAKDSGLPEADAVERAFEIINFRTRVGNNQLAAAARNVVFLNAFYAASRVALKVLKSEGIAPTARAEARNTLLTNMAWIFGMSILNAMMNVGDDDYEKMSRQEQANKLTLPGMHGWGIPLRPDVFLLPKYIAEAIVRQSSDKYADDPAKLRAGLSDAVGNAVFSGPVPVGQPIKLAVELATNHSFFTGRPIVGAGLEKLEPYMQYSAGTSALAKDIGRGAKDLVDAMGMDGKGISPAKIDAFIQGTMGMYGATAVLLTNSLVNSTPTQSMQDTIASLPGMGRVGVKEFDSQVKTDFYDLASKVTTAVDTANKLKSTGQGAEYREYVKENKNLIKYGPFVRKMEQQLGALRKTMATISARTDLTKDQKEDRLRTYKLSEQRMMNRLAPAIKKYRTDALQ